MLKKGELMTKDIHGGCGDWEESRIHCRSKWNGSASTCLSCCKSRMCKTLCRPIQYNYPLEICSMAQTDDSTQSVPHDSNPAIEQQEVTPNCRKS